MFSLSINYYIPFIFCARLSDRPPAHPESYTMGIRGSFIGGKVIGCECDHALHLVPSLKMDKTSSYTLMVSTESNLLLVWKKSLQQFHIKDKSVLTYLAATLVHSFTYIERDTNSNRNNIFSSIINHRGSVLAFSTQIRGFKPGRSRRIFKGEKILSTPSFG